MTQLVTEIRNAGSAGPPGFRYVVRAVDKALRILEVLGRDATEFGLLELSQRLAIEKSTLHRLLGTLEARKFVSRDPRSLKYSLGIRMLELGAAVTARSLLGRAATPVLDRLMLSSRQTVNLAILDGEEVLYVAKRECPQPLRLTVEVGSRLPFHCTALGKVMLAFRPVQEVRRVLGRRKQLRRFTPHTLTNPRDVLKQLDEIRCAGVAIDREELVLGLRCLAAPILDFTGYAVGAMSISVPAGDFDEKRVGQLRLLLLDAVAEVSKVLGGPATHHGPEKTGWTVPAAS